MKPTTKRKVTAKAKAKTSTKRTYMKQETLVTKVYSAMKRRSSRTTGQVSVGRNEISEILNLHPRSVDRAVSVLKNRNAIWRNGHRYLINLKA